MGKLDNDRSASALGDICPLPPSVQMFRLQAILMDNHVACHTQEPNVDLHLAGDEQAVPRMAPFPIQTTELLGWGVEKRCFCHCFLHGTLDEPVRQSESAWQSQGLRDELQRAPFGIHDGGHQAARGLGDGMPGAI